MRREQTPPRAGFLTRRAHQVGAVIVRQQRLQTPPAPANGSAAFCYLRNDSVGRYGDTADPSRGLPCRGSLVDATFYGTDPVFTPASSLYDGRQDPFSFYNKSEFASLSSMNPYGFFPHSYDPGTGGSKTAALVPDEANNFLVFLDERLSSVHAQALVTYMGDGGYLDQQTLAVSVEMNTLNAGTGIFCKVIVTFTWQVRCTVPRPPSDAERRSDWIRAGWGQVLRSGRVQCNSIASRVPYLSSRAKSDWIRAGWGHHQLGLSHQLRPGVHQPEPVANPGVRVHSLLGLQRPPRDMGSAATMLCD